MTSSDADFRFEFPRPKLVFKVRPTVPRPHNPAYAFRADCLEWPGAIGFGATKQDAVKEATEAVKEFLAVESRDAELVEVEIR